MIRTTLVFLACTSCAALAGKADPAVATRDAYVALLQACDIYDALPERQHTHEADMACMDLRDVCVK